MHDVPSHDPSSCIYYISDMALIHIGNGLLDRTKLINGLLGVNGEWR